MTLERRIERLERTNRRCRLSLAAVGLGAIAGVWVSAGKDNTVPDVFRAKMFEVVDDNGKVLVQLKPSPQGTGTVTSFDKNGNPLAALGGVQVGDGYLGMVVTYNGKGQNLVGLGVSEYGTGAVAIFNSKGQKLVEFGSTESGNGTVATYNNKDQMVVGLGVTDDGSTGAIVILRGDQKLVTLGATDDGGSVTVANSSGQLVAGLGADEYGNGFVLVQDRQGNANRLTAEP